MSIFRRSLMMVASQRSQPVEEWELVAELASVSTTVSTSSNARIKPNVSWENAQYKIVFDWIVTNFSDAYQSANIDIRAQDSTIHLLQRSGLSQGDSGRLDTIYQNSIVRSREAFVLQRITSGPTYTLTLSNIKIYKHI